MLYTILLVLMLNAIFKEVESEYCNKNGLGGCWIDGECRTRLEIDSLLEAAKLPKTNAQEDLTNDTCDQIRTSLNMTKDSPSGTTESEAASSTSTPTVKKDDGGREEDGKSSGVTKDSPSGTTESEAASSTSTPTAPTIGPEAAATGGETGPGETASAGERGTTTVGSRESTSNCAVNYQFLNYVKNNNETYCMIRLKTDRSLRSCIKAKVLWELLRNSSVQERQNRFSWDHQWVSHHEYLIMRETNLAYINEFGPYGTLTRAPKIGPFVHQLAPALSVDEVDSVNEVASGEDYRFKGPYSLCKFLTINNIFDLIDQAHTVACPNVPPECANTQPGIMNDGVFYNVKYESGSPTKCSLPYVNGDKKCVSLSNVIDLVKSTSIYDQHYDKKEFSSWRQKLYDGTNKGYFKLRQEGQSAKAALNKTSEVLGLREAKHEQTITFNEGDSVSLIGPVALCHIFAYHIPLSDEQSPLNTKLEAC